MAFQARFVPLQRWIGQKTSSRVNAAFTSTYEKTLYDLEHEIRMLNGKNVVIEAGFKREDIRNDGWPRSGRKPSEPGVIVSFTTKRGALAFPCDRFWFWEDNLRAIALGLEALRKIDRYGITQGGEQYTGWRALPEPEPQVTKSAAEKAADYLESEYPGQFDRTKDWSLSYLESVWRSLAKLAHPDRQGGSHDKFVRLKNAIDALRKEAE